MLLNGLSLSNKTSFSKYFHLHKSLRDKTRTEMTNITGCKPPCSYRKFTEVGDTLLFKHDRFGIRVLGFLVLYSITQNSFKDIKSCLPIMRFKKRRST